MLFVLAVVVDGCVLISLSAGLILTLPVMLQVTVPVALPSATLPADAGLAMAAKPLSCECGGRSRQHNLPKHALSSRMFQGFSLDPGGRSSTPRLSPAKLDPPPTRQGNSTRRNRPWFLVRCTTLCSNSRRFALSVAARPLSVSRTRHLRRQEREMSPRQTRSDGACYLRPLGQCYRDNRANRARLPTYRARFTREISPILRGESPQ